MQTTTRRLTAVMAALVLVLAACGDDDAAPTTAGDAATTTTAGNATTTTTGSDDGEGRFGLPVIDPLDVAPGDVGIAGSSTVFPLATAVVTKWIDEGGPEYSIDSIGSGGGFERFCVEGASDIATASRPIKDSEVASCQEIGRDPIEIRVGTDALSVVISNGNYFAQEMTLEELATLFSLPAGSTWDQVNPDFPAHPIKRFSPGADSGTFDYFNEEVFDEADPPPILEAGVEIVGEDDNLTVRGVSEDGCTEGDLSSTCAAGYFGFAFFDQNADRLQAVAVGGVAPNAEAVSEGTYPLARPLFMYTDAGIVAEKPQVAAFITYVLNNVDEVIGDVGYFPAPEEALQTAADRIAGAAGY
ncbi:MAG: substrate-binding domain-containing protein [Acidimicrobiia bacterium]|nr:substrate-binding domain-containing protein [Acidimicrobiia bacterium]